MHNLATINGKSAFVLRGNRNDAWHALGQRVQDAMTAQDAMREAQLDWKAIKVQNYARNPLGKVIPVDSYSVFRDIDNQLLASSVGKGFTLVQNSEAFSFVDSLLQAENGAHYDTAGALGLGETIFLSVRIPDADMEIVSGDKLETYLIFTTAHDGTGASTAFLSTTRPVCQNTLRQALSTNSGIVRIKHTKNQSSRFEMAKRTMQGVKMDAVALREKLQLLAARQITRESLTAIMDRLFPKNEDGKIQTRRDNILADVVLLYDSNDDDAIPEIRGTAYNLLNAVTEYTDHYRVARMTEGRLGTIDTARAENAVIGTGDKLKNSALEVILEMTDGAPLHKTLIMPITRDTMDAGKLGLLKGQGQGQG